MQSKFIFTLVVSSLLITYTFGQGCAAGQYQVTAGSTCVPCPINRYCLVSATDVAAAAAPQNCPINTQRTTTGGAQQSDCTNCPAGQGSVAGSACANCLAGQTSTAGQPCTACAAGETSAAGAATCSACPVGKYCERSGTGLAQVSTAQNCAAGKSAPAGSDAAADCVPCTAGQYAEAGNACTACPVGYYCTAGATATDAAIRNACPTGTTTSGTGKTAASDCNVSAGAGVLVSSTLAVTVLGSIMLL